MYDDDTIATWQPQPWCYSQPRKLNVPPNNPTTYYALAFFPRDGFSVKQGITVNTLVAGP